MSTLLSLEQINRQSPEILQDENIIIEIFSNGVLLVFDRKNGYTRTASVRTVAKVASYLKGHGYRINSVYQLSFFEGEMATIIDYDPISTP